MVSKKAVFTFLIIFYPLLTAMGALPGQSPDRAPTPAKKFTATFIDQTNVITDCREASIEGETFLQGKRGSGIMAIPFENIREVSFVLQGEILNGVVRLNDGNAVELALNRNQRAYGKTKYGNFQIKLSELQKMVLNKTQ